MEGFNMCTKTLQTTENEILCHCFIESFEFLGKKMEWINYLCFM